MSLTQNPCTQELLVEERLSPRPHFTDVGSEDQKGYMTCPGSQGYLVEVLGMELRIWFDDAFLQHP